MNTNEASEGVLQLLTGLYTYIRSKLKRNYIYLRCVLFRNNCKTTGKLNRKTNLITPLKGQNHDIDDYRSEIFALKTIQNDS